MIKSFLLNNLLVPLRQISPPMLLASAALHGLLFVVPISSNSTNVEVSKTSDSSDTEDKENVCDEDSSLANEAGEDSIIEEGEADSLAEEDGADSLSEEDSLAEEDGADSLSEEDSLAEEGGADSLSEEDSLAEEDGADSLSEEDSLTEEGGADSLSEEDSLTEEDGTEIGGEDIEDGETPTPDSDEELCEKETSLPKGKAVKVPAEIPLLSDLENGSDSEEIGDEDNTTPDLALGELDDSGDSADETSNADFSGDEEDISSDEEDISSDEISNADFSGDDSGNSADETSNADFSGNEEDTLSEELPTPSDNLPLSEPESEPEIAFTPSPSVDETDEIPSEPVETTEDTVSETVDETSDTVRETGDELEEAANPESTDTTIESNPEETTSETENQPQSAPVNPFAEFPKYTSVKPNFCGVKSAKIDRRTRLTSDSLDAVQVYFEKKLENTDFQVEKLADKPDTKVYQVSKGNLIQYLQLFAVEEQGTMILLSSQRVDCYRLSNEIQPELPKTEEQSFDATFQKLYVQLGWTKEEDFAATTLVEKVFGKDTNKTPDELALLVKSQLESEGFKASKVNEETSELLYEVKKGEFTKYISFVPTKEGKGAIIFTLKNTP